MALPRYAAADTRLNVGTLHGGDNVNIIPSWAEMTLEARATDAAICADLVHRVETVLAAAGSMHDVAVEVRPTGGSTTIRCDDELVREIDRIARELDAPEPESSVHKMGGSDDASLFAERVQQAGGLATYFTVGGGNRAPHHNPLFDVDESAMLVALNLLERLVRRRRP
jgi:aminobenzoyl-glutamate utilization protein A